MQFSIPAAVALRRGALDAITRGDMKVVSSIF